MKIVIDHKIPFIRGLFEPFADVVYVPGSDIRREHLMDADCLLVRTRTRCDQKLLEGTRVKFIGTATIGFDHIDTHWCTGNGIRWTNAPGCNSGSVAQYIASALLVTARRRNFNLKDKTLGIIGAGHVGTKVEKTALALGMRVILNDPPRARAEGPGPFQELGKTLESSDIVSIHVPLNREGADKTYQMAGREFLGKMKPGAILINSSRGEVLCESEVVESIKTTGQPAGLILDVWQNEPRLNPELLQLADIATPHIAGYSLDGKWNATRMMVNAVVQEFNLPSPVLIPSLPDQDFMLQSGVSSAMSLQEYILATYDILADDRRLRESPESFEEQRNNYPVRREFNAYTIKPFPAGETGKILSQLGFK
jgi:erythronate-4-phosphate dehydrogenase